jgi:hypothetical protein
MTVFSFHVLDNEWRALYKPSTLTGRRGSDLDEEKDASDNGNTRWFGKVLQIFQCSLYIKPTNFSPTETYKNMIWIVTMKFGKCSWITNFYTTD